jgi:hypothetical protein
MAKQGFGAIFQLSATTITGSTGKLSEVTSVGIPNPTQGTSETTHHESAGGVREYLPDLVDIAEFTVKLNVTPGSVTDLAAAAAAVSRALYFFKSTVPGSSTTFTYTGQGIVTSYETDDVDISGIMKAVLKVKPTGAVTRA